MINLIITIIGIVSLISLILFIVVYMSEYNFKSFMEELKDKLYSLGEFDYKYYNAFLSLFNEYYDTTTLTVTFNALKAFCVIFSIFCLLLTVLLWQNNYCLKQRQFLRYILSIIYLILCLGIAFVFVVFSLNAKNKVDLSEDTIYRFDDEFNQKVKSNLNYMYNRKIYMFTCVFFSQICFVAMGVIIVVQYQMNKKQNVDIIDDSEKNIGVAPLNSK